MMTITNGTALAAAIGLLISSASALAQSVPPVPAPPPTDSPAPQSPAPAAPPRPQFQAAPSEEAVPACPANQFASKFSDVTPDDWAYEAVNRLAIGEYRCFPIPSRS